MLVDVKPGQAISTWRPFFLFSIRTTSRNPWSANFEAEYPVLPGSPLYPATEEIPAMLLSSIVFSPKKAEGLIKLHELRMQGIDIGQLRFPLLSMVTNALAGKADSKQLTKTTEKVRAGDKKTIQMLTSISDQLTLPVAYEADWESRVISILMKVGHGL